MICSCVGLEVSILILQSQIYIGTDDSMDERIQTVLVAAIVFVLASFAICYVGAHRRSPLSAFTVCAAHVKA